MKSGVVAYLLWFFGGFLALHRFYLNRPGSAIFFLLTCGGFGIWWLLDALLIPGMVAEENVFFIRRFGGGGNVNVNVYNR